jgi:hypothetical protein
VLVAAGFALEVGSFGGPGAGDGIRVDLEEREVTELEEDLVAVFGVDLLDYRVILSACRTLVIAVLGKIDTAAAFALDMAGHSGGTLAGVRGC